MSPTPQVCTPPATKRPGESLAAPAAAGQGVCTTYRRERASRAASLPGRRISSRSAFLSAFSFLLLAMLIAISSPAMATISAAIPHTTGAVTCSIFVSPSVTTAFIVGCCLLALVVFHLAMVPAMNWIVRRFS